MPRFMSSFTCTERIAFIALAAYGFTAHLKPFASPFFCARAEEAGQCVPVCQIAVFPFSWPFVRFPGLYPQMYHTRTQMCLDRFASNHRRNFALFNVYSHLALHKF